MLSRGSKSERQRKRERPESSLRERKKIAEVRQRFYLTSDNFKVIGLF